MADADPNVVFVQKSQDGRLTVVGGDHTDPQIQLFFANGDLDPPVLWPSPLGDVDPGEDFDSGQDGPQLSSGQRISFVQDSVNAIADSDAVFERFDMDVRGPELDGFVDHQLDQANDRGARFVDQFLFSRIDVIDGFGKVNCGICEFLQDRVGRFPFDLTVQPVNGFEDTGSGRQSGDDIAIEDKPQLFQGIDVARVADHDLQSVIHFGQRQDRVFPGH